MVSFQFILKKEIVFLKIKIMTTFTAPIGGDSKKIDNVELIPVGFQLCTFYGLCDIGTQDGGMYGPKHKVNLAFEFPLQYRVFYEGDDAKPSCVFQFESMSMHKDGNLRSKFIEPMIGRKLTDAEAGSFDISQLLGKQFIATIAHSPDGNWANIQSITPLNEQNKAMFQLDTPHVAQINDTYFFHLSQGFDSENYATLPKFLREKLINSHEGIAHKAVGGIFREAVAGTAPSPATTSGQGGLEMIDKTVTYEAYIQAGWTDEQLITNGKAKRIAAIAPPTPVVAPAPVVSPAPPVVAAPPVTPPTPTPPPVANAEPVLVFKDSANVLSEWLKSGWTPETIVEAGYATFQ
jgi:hypothetical protein